MQSGTITIPLAKPLVLSCNCGKFVRVNEIDLDIVEGHIFNVNLHMPPQDAKDVYDDMLFVYQIYGVLAAWGDPGLYYYLDFAEADDQLEGVAVLCVSQVSDHAPVIEWFAALPGAKVEQD